MSAPILNKHSLLYLEDSHPPEDEYPWPKDGESIVWVSHDVQQNRRI